MQIVTDSAMDLTDEQMAGFSIHKVPLQLTLEGKTYSSGIDITPVEFYSMLDKTDAFPLTSQPSAGDFAHLYRKLALTDPDILSIHISSGLSGTFNSARAGAAMVPEANVTLFDSMTLSCPLGWQVEAAAKAIQAGQGLDQILPMLETLRAQVQGIFTVATLKYLIHGGRVSHLKGLIASLLNIKPIIGVEKVRGMYATLGQERTLKRASAKVAEILLTWWPEGTRMRIQPLHGDNPEGLGYMKERLTELYDVVWSPLASVTPALGAHTGPSLVGLAAGPASLFE